MIGTTIFASLQELSLSFSVMCLIDAFNLLRRMITINKNIDYTIF